MKTTRLFLVAFFIMSTWAHAAQPQVLAQLEQKSIRQLTQEMGAEGVPEEQAEKMLSLMRQNSYKEQNLVRAQQTVLRAAEENIPTEPVMNKAMEGMAKQVPQEQVIGAMETVRNRYSYAYRLARSLTDDKRVIKPMAETIADCLAAGMTKQEMDKVVAQVRTQTRQQTKNQAADLSLQTALTVRSMVRLGASPADTANTVGQALQQQFTAQNMEQLRNRFADETRNTSARQLAHQYAGSIGKSDGSGKNRSDGKDSGKNGGSGGSGSGSGDSGSGGSGGSGSGGSGSGSGGSGGGSGSGGSGGSGSGSGDSGSGGSGGSGSGGSGSGSGGSGGGSGSGGSGSGQWQRRQRQRQRRQWQRRQWQRRQRQRQRQRRQRQRQRRQRRRQRAAAAAAAAVAMAAVAMTAAENSSSFKGIAGSRYPG